MNPGDSQRAGIFFLAIFCLVIYGSSLFIAGRSRLVKPIPFGRQDNGSMAVEVQGGKKDGIYFLPTGTGLGSLFPSVVPDDMEITPGSLWSLSPEGKLQKGTMSAAVRLALDIPLDVNLATVPDLSLVPGLGEKTALAIVSRRDERGGFSSLDELKEVPGIKEKRLARIRHFLSVGEKR